MDALKVKKEMEEEITIEYNDVSKGQAHLIETLSGTDTSSKSIQPKNKPAIMPPEKTAKLKYKLLHKTLKLGVTIYDHKNASTSLHSKHKKTFPPASSDIIKVISKKVASEKKSTKVTKSSVNPTKSRKPTIINPLFTNSSKELPNCSYTKPIHPLQFSGARFVHTQVHSNLVLQTLLKDIINLNNEIDTVNEDVINKEVASLRAKNNLPSLNAEVNVSGNLDLEDSDFSENSEDESYNSYYDTKTSENYGKDSGYDNESQHSESLEDDTISEVQENLRNGTEKSLVLAEPEYIDLDKYFGSKKRTITVSRASLMDIKTISKSYQHKEKSKNRPRRTVLTCSICNKTLMSKRSYTNHTKNGTGCIKTCSEEKKLTFEEDILRRRALPHRQEKHFNTMKNKVETFTCVQCPLLFFSKVSLDMHYNTCHKQKMSCLFCSLQCETLTEYNLHIATKHSQRMKKDSTSSDSDCLEIVEINDEDC